MALREGVRLINTDSFTSLGVIFKQKILHSRFLQTREFCFSEVLVNSKLCDCHLFRWIFDNSRCSCLFLCLLRMGIYCTKTKMKYWLHELLAKAQINVVSTGIPVSFKLNRDRDPTPPPCLSSTVNFWTQNREFNHELTGKRTL